MSAPGEVRILESTVDHCSQHRMVKCSDGRVYRIADESPEIAIAPDGARYWAGIRTLWPSAPIQNESRDVPA